MLHHFFRLARKEEIASTVVQSLKVLLAMKPGSIFHVSKQVRCLRGFLLIYDILLITLILFLSYITKKPYIFFGREKKF